MSLYVVRSWNRVADFLFAQKRLDFAVFRVSRDPGTGKIPSLFDLTLGAI